MIGLTPQQNRLLGYLEGYLQQHNGVAPSYEEMAAAVGATSKSSAFRLVIALEERGFIRRLPNRARAIEVVPQHPLHAVPTAALLAELARRGEGRAAA